MSDYPRLRYGLEAMPFEHENQRMVLITDRLGFSKESLLVAQPVAELLMHMNGENSLRDLQALFMRRTGQILYMENLEGILAKLDEHLFLDNERFLRFFAEEAVRFRKDPVRKAQHSGISYPAEADALRRHLDGFFSLEADGPGFPEKEKDKRRLVGLVAPHIDLRSGGPCFAHAYKAAFEAVSPDVWVILGTGHELVENYFAITDKDFETPLGTVSCDRECCEELIRKIPKNILAGEYGHRREHSVEFQTVFIAHLLPESSIVPLLCSFSLEDWEADGQYIDETASLLGNLEAICGGTVGFIASVDLAHIGPRYGDRFFPDQGVITDHMTSDRRLLDALEKCDAREFIGILERERNKRRICGMAPLYMLAKILEGRASGKLLQHRHATVDEHNSFVTFASMAFYE